MFDRLQPAFSIYSKGQISDITHGITGRFRIMNTVEHKVPLQRRERHHGLKLIGNIEQRFQVVTRFQLNGLHRHIRLRNKRLDHPGEVTIEGFHRVTIEQIRVVLNHTGQSVATVQQHHGDILAGHHQLYRHGFNFQAANNLMLFQFLATAVGKRHLI